MAKLRVSQRGQKVIASPIRKFLPLMQAAEKQGVRNWFLEDETVAPLTGIPESLEYLRALKF